MSDFVMFLIGKIGSGKVPYIKFYKVEHINFIGIGRT